MAEAAFGIFLRLLRERRDLSLRELGRLAEVDHAYIHRLETGTKESPSPEVLGKLGRALKANKRDSEILALLATLSQVPPEMGEFLALDTSVTPVEVKALAGFAFRGKRTSYQELLQRIRAFLAEEEGNG
ncbi:helix-turn-helix domain-containing protein [Mesorhizobium sp. M1273]|uniref:helix-turn-helix domain-containing protein n=1 Tax=Mesorhizobium sp. M1273 TaxID=2957075 RepID=UPI00333CF6EA